MRISDWSSDVCSSDLQFVEAQFDGLADFIKLPELAARNLFDLFDHIGFGLDARRPLILRLQDNEAVRNVWRHRIGGDIGGTRLGEQQLNFGEFIECLLDLALHYQGMFKARKRVVKGGGVDVRGEIGGGGVREQK